MMTTAINMERGDIMDIVEAKCPPLIEILSEIPDLRKAKGKRHPLPAILALTCVATMCGHRRKKIGSYSPLPMQAPPFINGTRSDCHSSEGWNPGVR